MLISKNWLSDYVNLEKVTPEDLAEKLTIRTVEIEGVSTLGELLHNVVIGLVNKVEKHPDADRLKVCHVDIGNGEVQVVCGGSNVTKGMKVALGKLGAKVKWHGEEELIELKKTKIRGVESFGMICASEEIGLGELFPQKDEKEIIDLSHLDFEIGTPLMKALAQDDVVLEVDNKSMTHRPDLWGHYGIAREASAIYQKKLIEYKPAKIKAGRKRKLSAKVKDKILCPRYMAVAMSGIKIGSSPSWMQSRLQSVGVRPINNIVDITNYVMLDIGQPMHAFDGSKIGDEIIIRNAKKGEGIDTLDGQKQTLTSENLVIADKNKAIAIAGVIGGANSEVEEGTTDIVFESANFDSTNVRKTSTAIGVRTDSSSRFEKSLDPNNAEIALRRAVELVKELIPGAEVSSNIVDESNFELNQGPIEIDFSYIEERIGESIEMGIAVNILDRLGFGVKVKGGVFSVSVPSWRATKDISIAEDIVEEVARIYGYENIQPTLPTFGIKPPANNPIRSLERKITEQLAYGQGYSEVHNYSFVSGQTIVRVGLNKKDYLELDNPVSKERPYLRKHLIPNLLEKIEMNAHRFNSVKLFEIGRTFDNKNIERQDTMLAVAFTQKGNDVPFYEVSNAVTDSLNNKEIEIISTSGKTGLPFINPGRFAEIKVNGTDVGFVGELHPATQEAFGIDNRVAIAEINLSVLSGLVLEEGSYSRLPVYPSVIHDIALVVDKSVEHAQIVNTVLKSNNLVVNAELFDVFEGKKLGESKKSMAYHIEYRSDEKTLETEEVGKIEKKIKEVLKKKFGANIRD